MASAMEHKYFGIEIRQNEVIRIKEQMKKLDRFFDIEIGDSQNYPLQDDFYDFSYTCPPYYNLEIYSKLEGDLSNAGDYQTFLQMLWNCLKNNYKALKKDCLSVWVVGNFRNEKTGNLQNLDGDLIKFGKLAGFKLHDIIIWWGASKCASQRCGQFEANRRSVRVHEYIIIFRK